MIFQNTFLKNLQEKCNNMLEQCRNIVEENKNLTSQPTCACDIETETTTQDVSYNVFDFYQEMREELYGKKLMIPEKLNLIKLFRVNSKHQMH